MARTCASPRFSRVALLVVALAAAPAAAFSPSIPGAWSTGAQARAASMCQVAGRGGAGRSGVLSVGMSMGIEGMGIKEGAIGRGRGIPNKEMQELAAATITEQASQSPMTPEEARKNRRVVRAGETTPRLDIEEFLASRKQREATRPKKAGGGPGSGGGMSLKPRGMMDEEEKELLKQRQAHARWVLNRNAPETERGVLYAPGWNDFDSAGQMVRDGHEEEEKVAATKANAESQEEERVLKTPLEVLDMLKTLNFHVRDLTTPLEAVAVPVLQEKTGVVPEGEEEEPDVWVRPASARRLSGLDREVGKIKLMRKYWMDWLEGLDEELMEIKDPGKHSQEIREAFLADMDEAAENGMEVRPVTDAEIALHLDDQDHRKALRNRSRNAKDAGETSKLANRMAGDLVSRFGEAIPKNIDGRVTALLSGHNEPVKGPNSPLKSSLVAMAILEEYLGFAEDDEDNSLWKVAEPVLSLDWNEGKRSDFDTQGNVQEEMGQARLARNTLKADFVRGGEVERPPSASGGIYGPTSGDADGPSEGETTRAGFPAEGDSVSVKVMAETPLGFALLVNSQYDGLVYHSEVFEDPPHVGAVTQAWVSKVRRDGKLDITLRRPGAHMRILDGARRVYQVLEEGGGTMPVGDRTDPDIVRDFLGLSKKNFKDALGHLYRRTMVKIDPESVTLREQGEWRDDASEIVNAPARPPPSERPATGSSDYARSGQDRGQDRYSGGQDQGRSYGGGQDREARSYGRGQDRGRGAYNRGQDQGRAYGGGQDREPRGYQGQDRGRGSYNGGQDRSNDGQDRARDLRRSRDQARGGGGYDDSRGGPSGDYNSPRRGDRSREDAPRGRADFSRRQDSGPAVDAASPGTSWGTFVPASVTEE